jgi:hypothetical protein
LNTRTILSSCFGSTFTKKKRNNGTNLKLIVKFKWRRRRKEERKQQEEQEIDSTASGFCILSLYWPFGYDRVVLVKLLKHSFSVSSLRHFTSLRQIRLRQNSLRNFQIV